MYNELKLFSMSAFIVVREKGVIQLKNLHILLGIELEYNFCAENYFSFDKLSKMLQSFNWKSLKVSLNWMLSYSYLWYSLISKELFMRTDLFFNFTFPHSEVGLAPFQWISS